MRLVAVADTHLFHGELQVPDGDVLIHAGDMCRRGDLTELETVARWLAALPHPTKVVIAGNHDWSFVRNPLESRRLLGEGVHYLEDSGLTLNGLHFWGSPWQPEFHSWAFNLPRGAALQEKWALIPTNTDVLMTHGPPRNIGDGTGDESGYGGASRVGCDDLRARVLALRPALHLFGHIHDSGGVWSIDGTTFANVTTWECERRPTVIDIDPKTKRVSPIEVPAAKR